MLSYPPSVSAVIGGTVGQLGISRHWFCVSSLCARMSRAGTLTCRYRTNPNNPHTLRLIRATGVTQCDQQLMHCSLAEK